MLIQWWLKCTSADVNPGFMMFGELILGMLYRWGLAENDPGNPSRGQNSYVQWDALYH